MSNHAPSARLGLRSDRVSTAEELVEQVSSSVGDLAGIRTLPAQVYTSPSFYEFERSAIFDRSWLFLCHESEVPNVGDFHSVIVGDEPLLVVRSTDGVNVLSAVCQHRGYSLSSGDGNCRYLRCPYHSWTYGLDGRLVGAPSMSPVHDLDSLRQEIALPALRVEIWHGMVFANFDTQAEPLAPSLRRLEKVVGQHRFEDLVVAETVYLDDLPFNWKNMQENALEEYHTSYVHKGFHDNAPAELVEHGAFEKGDGAIYRHAGMLIKGGEEVPGRPTFPVIDGLPERDRGYLIFVSIPPTFFAAVYPHGLKLFRIIPRAVNRTQLRISFLFPPETTELPEFSSMLERQVAFIDHIDRPDIESNTRMFEGLQSRFAPRGPFSPQETTLEQLNRWLYERYQGFLNSDEALRVT